MARLVHVSDDRVVAVVRGTRAYRVIVERQGAEFFSQCSCPYFRRELSPCKHVCAALFAARARGFMTGGALAIEDEKLDVELLVLEEESDDVLPQPSTLRPPGRSKPRRDPDWRELLDMAITPTRGASSFETSWPAGREIVYVFDYGATLERGRLTLDVATRERKANGEWSKPRPAKVDADELPALPDAEDREILALLRGAPSDAYGWAPSYGSAASTFLLSPPLSDALVPRIALTGRCFRRTDSADSTLEPLAWDDGPPWELWLEAESDDAGARRTIAASLRRDSSRIALADADLLYAGGLVFRGGSVARLEDFGAFPWISLLRRVERLTVPAEQEGELVERLYQSRALPRLDFPPELAFTEVRVEPRPRIILRRPKERWRSGDRLSAEISFDYDGVVVPAEHPGRSIADSVTRRVLVRDPAAEGAAARRLVPLGFRNLASRYGAIGEREWQLSPKHVPKAVRALLAENWHVEAEGRLYRSASAVRVAVKSTIDWFELEGEVDFGGAAASFPRLLAATRRGETVVALDDGTFGMIPEEWLETYGTVAGLGSPQGDRLRFARGQVGFLDALLAASPAATCDEAFAAARAEIRAFAGIEHADPPHGFAGELRPYQRDGLGWIRFLERFRFGGCLADDMGLGKTVQVLAWLEELRERRSRDSTEGPRASLVVAPRSLVFNWKEEAARFTPRLRVLDHTGAARTRDGSRFHDYDLVLTTYGTLRRDAAELADVAFDWVVLDEAQAIKNEATGSAKAARLLKANHRLALSGTPIENHLGELWSLFEFLNPGMLGAASVFRSLHAKKDDDGFRELLARALRPFLLRRTKGQVAKELPPKTEQTIAVELDRAERELYDELRDHYRRSLLARVDRDGVGKSTIHVLEALLRLRQAACHPGLVDRARAGAPSAKLESLLHHLVEVLDEGHKALVFSQFTSLLSIVCRRLDAEGIAYAYLDGKTRDRASRVERFQSDPACRLFLVSLKAGGLGLNLTAAEYVFLLDPWWNPAIEAQAIDRAHRIGQERHVFAYRLIARDTVEEKILDLQRSKRELADAILGADKSLIRSLSREDLELLLS